MLMNGSYGGGALVFLVFNYLFYKAHISLKWLFNIYAAIAGTIPFHFKSIIGAIALVILFTWPLRKYDEVKHEGEHHSQIERLDLFN